jgi:hypothetical protein
MWRVVLVEALLAWGSLHADAATDPLEAYRTELETAVGLLHAADELESSGEGSAAAAKRTIAIDQLRAIDASLVALGASEDIAKLRHSVWYHLGEAECADGQPDIGRTALLRALYLYDTEARSERVQAALDRCPARSDTNRVQAEDDEESPVPVSRRAPVVDDEPRTNPYAAERHAHKPQSEARKGNGSAVAVGLLSAAGALTILTTYAVYEQNPGMDAPTWTTLQVANTLGWTAVLGAGVVLIVNVDAQHRPIPTIWFTRGF